MSIAGGCCVAPVAAVCVDQDDEPGEFPRAPQQRADQAARLAAGQRLPAAGRAQRGAREVPRHDHAGRAQRAPGDADRALEEPAQRAQPVLRARVRPPTHPVVVCLS